MELTFGEQIKIILKRKNMTIRMLAELIEQQTGKPMSRQNLTQKLNRDNFQEQDMKEIAQALGCVVQISVIDPMEATVASLQSMMQTAAPSVEQENAAALPSVSAFPGERTAEKEEVEEDDVDSDVLREIEMALMESIQEEMKRPGKDSFKEDQKWQEQVQSGQTEQQGSESGWEEAEAEEYDSLAWAHQRPTVWPRLILPGERAPREKGGSQEQEREPLVEMQEELTVPEGRALSEEEEPEFVETEDDLDGLEFIEMEELEGGDISGVSAPYALKREQAEPLMEEADGGEDFYEEPISYRTPAGTAGGDISFASAPYVIPRAPEEEQEYAEGWPGEGDGYVELSLDDIPENPVDDAAETVQEFGMDQKEPDIDQKIASWDAAVKRQLERPILLSAEERKARKAAREAEEAKTRAQEPEQVFPCVNPLTGKEYETNTVRHHPTKPDMLLVYDQDEHKWIEQAERAFTNFQIRKRAMLGKDYEPPVYLD